MNRIVYRSGFKYQLAQTYLVEISIRPDADIITEYVKLNRAGMLAIMEGYAWDGPSGPAFDTPSFMRASLVHDALYQLMREEHLDATVWRAVADGEMRRICLEDGMPRIRAWWCHRGVRLGGGPSASPSGSKQIFATVYSGERSRIFENRSSSS
mgnify:CR=1 FL=1